MSALTIAELVLHTVVAVCMLSFFLVGVSYGFLHGLHRVRRITRRRRHQARLLDLEAARTIRRPVHRGGPGVIVYADPRDVEASRVPRLVEHLTAIHAASERLLDAAEIAEYDQAFCEKLRRLHYHNAGLLEQVAAARRA